MFSRQLFCWIVGFTIYFPSLVAQTKPKPLTFSGSVGVMGELYHISGTEARRPPASGQTYGNVSFNLLGLQSGFSLLYSTEDNRVRQSMNQVGFNTQWKWGKLGLGAVNPSLGRYALNGIRLMGGQVEFSPKILVLNLAAGETKRASKGTAEQLFESGSYAQRLYAGRLALGDPKGYLGLLVTYASDDIKSVSIVPPTVKPTQNFTITPDLLIPIADNKITLQFQGTISAFSADISQDTVSVENLPTDFGVDKIIQKLVKYFPVHTSSRADFAANGELRVAYPNFSFRGGYERIQPNFRSLGMGSIQDDRQILYAQPMLRLFKRKLNLGFQFNRQSNNLLGQRTATMQRTQLGASVQARLGSRLILNGTWSQMRNQNTPEDGVPNANDLIQNQQTQVFTLVPILTLRTGRTSHALSTTLSWKSYADESPSVLSGKRPAVNFDSKTLNAGYNVALPSGISLQASGNLLQNTNAYNETASIGFLAGAGTSLLKRRLSLNVNTSWNRNTTTPKSGDVLLSSQWTAMLQSNFALSQKDALHLGIQTLSNRTEGTQPLSFQEIRGTLRIEHRF